MEKQLPVFVIYIGYRKLISKDGKSDYHANISQRKPAIAILILDKVYFRPMGEMIAHYSFAASNEQKMDMRAQFMSDSL